MLIRRTSVIYSQLHKQLFLVHVVVSRDMTFINIWCISYNTSGKLVQNQMSLVSEERMGQKSSVTVVCVILFEVPSSSLVPGSFESVDESICLVVFHDTVRSQFFPIAASQIRAPGILGLGQLCHQCRAVIDVAALLVLDSEFDFLLREGINRDRGLSLQDFQITSPAFPLSPLR